MERRKKAEERDRALLLKVHEKTTWSSRMAASTKPVLLEPTEADNVDEEKQKKAKLNSIMAKANAANAQERRKEKENMTDFIGKKREMFLVQMALDTKRAEIRKLEAQARQREEALRKSEKMLDDDAQRFDAFLKENDVRAVEAIRKAEAETKAKQEKVQEIKKLNGQIAAIKSEMTKYDELLEQCKTYKDFLDALTPEDWKAEQRELKAQRKAERAARRLAAWEAKWRAEKEADAAALELRDVVKEPKDKKKNKTETAKDVARDKKLLEEAKQKLISSPAPAMPPKPADDPPSSDEELPMYFHKPQQLLDIFTALEESNLFLIQNSQETEEALEELKQKLQDMTSKMDAETETLTSQIDALKEAIKNEENKAQALTERAKPLLKESGKDEVAQLKELHEKVGEVYERCGFENDAAMDTLQMLANIESRLEEYLSRIDGMPEQYVEEAEKLKEKERRSRVREEKLEQQQLQQQEKINRSLARSQAPVVKKTGKPMMFRSAPSIKKKKQKETQIKENEDDDIAIFFQE
eukprot:JP435695.1.p1 GENE.JP435695.1~~JP435695.1.p1  ORF type:complete len:574 (+),score=184.33 JP435695.1:142-1722(+)